MMEHDPDKLFNLAVDAFGDYITMTVDNRRRTATGLDIDWMRWFSGNVHQALGSVMLPSHVANDVTDRLLTQLDMFMQIKCVVMEHLALSLLTSSLVHPAVSHFNVLETDTYYEYSHVDKMLIQDEMPEMNKLRVLQLDRMPKNVQLFSFPNLRQLTLICDDSLLESLLVTCGNIRKLDISDSSRVTDAGVQFLVKFQHLEQLNVKRTDITARGLTRLLTGLSKNKDSEGVSLLKSLGCDELMPQQLQLLVNNFQNLVKLEFVGFTEICDVSPLRNLKHLQSLSIDDGYEVKEIVEVIGHQLKELEIDYKDHACFFMEYCPSLARVKVGTAFCSHVFDMSPHCNLKSLKVVDLTVDKPSNFVSFILSNCTNVRVLKIMCIDVNSNELATAMLQNNPLEHLEELHWWSGRGKPLRPEVGRQIVRHCKNLEVMYGNMWWTRRRSRKPWFGDNGVYVYDEIVLHPRLI